jgi:uncharacterized protein (TIGR01244 family)
MRNAIQYDGRITVGSVPDHDDVEQLGQLGYRTIVDLRGPDEKFGGRVETEVRSLGMAYVSVSMSRVDLRVEDVQAFYDVVFEKGAEPVYAFSRFGRRPLALLVLIDVVARGEPVVRIFQRVSRYGLSLDGDIDLEAFVVKLAASEGFARIVEAVKERRPDLFG